MNGIQMNSALLALGALVTGTVCDGVDAAEFLPQSRDSNLMITFANLGFTAGYDGSGADAIVLSNDALDSDDDFFVFDDMFYGPDSFDRYNTGNFEAGQDVTFEPRVMAFNFLASASVAGEASPLITIDNDMFVYFEVSEDTSATLSVEYVGDTNVGDSRVGLRLREVGPGSDPIVLDDLFLLGQYPDGPNSVEVIVELIAGKRYRMYVDSHARSLVSVGAHEATIDVSLLLHCDADLNNDGSLDFFDMSLFLSSMPDWNDDTVFDFFDISAFLQSFTAGCP